ncbi:MAG TPA: hypothetical protein DCG04_21350 [Rhodospirillaceae bacterium]|jgi:copper homeostasis protein CutC|nr:hypothetical protein [Rhodospirillaceae bacterium]|tara:strand:- start:169 stop:450 length:282 start_codon:yes stop_codon:yes gene_type:complete
MAKPYSNTQDRITIIISGDVEADTCSALPESIEPLDSHSFQDNDMKTNNPAPYTRQKCIQHTVIREFCNKNRTTYSKKINPPMIDPPKPKNTA